MRTLDEKGTVLLSVQRRRMAWSEGVDEKENRPLLVQLLKCELN